METPLDNDTSDKKHDLKKEWQQAYDALEDDRRTWDSKERLLIGKLDDLISANRKSQVTDGSISTLQWERSARVMAQLPTGRIQSVSKKDVGKNTFMNILFTRYIIPNANSQYAHLIKMRLVDVLSRTWGACPVLHDYRVDDEYVGPDSWIINIRDFFPQPGKVTIQDCDWVMISNTVSLGWLKGRKGKDGWDDKEIDKIVEQAKDGVVPTKKNDPDRVGSNSPNIDKDLIQKGDYAEIELITKYERGKKGRWITFAPDFDGCIVKDVKNRHESGKIPVSLKQNFPRIDSIIGLSDIERGETLQRAKDSLINLYLDGVKMSIFPPMKINPTGVQLSTIRNAPAAKWLMDDPSKVQQHQVSPAGTNTFVQTYQFLHGALLSQHGTTDTRVSAENTSSDMGKTPAAIKQNQARENARDNWDRFMMEKFLEETYEYYINLLSVKQEKPIQIDIFEEEIAQLEAAGLEDVAEIRESGKSGVITISKSQIKGKYRYYIDQDTTMKKDDGDELEALIQIGTFMIQSGLAQMIGMDVREYAKRVFIKSGVQDWEKILPEQTDQMGVDPMTGQPIQEGAPQGQQVDPAVLEQQMLQADAQIEQLANQVLGA